MCMSFFSLNGFCVKLVKTQYCGLLVHYDKLFEFRKCGFYFVFALCPTFYVGLYVVAFVSSPRPFQFYFVS